MSSYNKEEIQELMVRKIASGELTPEEQFKLNSWLTADQKNQQEYNDLQAVKNLFAHKDLKIPDVEAGWQKVKQRISATPIVHVLHPKKSFAWLKYAAAIIVIATVSLVIYQANQTTNQTSPTEVVIQPGENRAELVLPSGKKLSLRNQSVIDISGEKNSLVATSKGNMLVYNATFGQEGYHKLIVPNGGKYEIILPDKTHVWVNSGSELTYRVDFRSAAIREVKLVGEAYFKVAKDKKHPFIVKTAHMDVEAVGTAFNVVAYKNADYTETTLVEGIVNVSDKLGNKQRMLAGSKIRIANKVSNVLPTLRQTVSVYGDYAWKDGVFAFDNMPLQQIMEQISRWYNIKVVFTNKEARQLHFTGTIEKDNNLNTVLKLISTSTNVKFEIEKQTLYITKPQY